MSERGTKEFLSDVLEAIKRIQDYTSGMDYQSFLADLKTRDAVIRNLEVIGEATKNIDDGFRKQYPVAPWKEMAGMRDKLIHHYFGINFEIVWTIIHDELQGVEKSIDSILGEIAPPESEPENSGKGP